MGKSSRDRYDPPGKPEATIMKWDQYKRHQLLGASILELLDGLCGALFLELLLVMPLAFFQQAAGDYAPCAALDDLVARSRVGKQFSLRVGWGCEC